MIRQLWAQRALLAQGWAEQVLFSIDDHGRINAIATGQEPATLAASIERVDTVLPGLPNLHSHAFQRAMAGLTEYRAQAADSFWTWRDLMYRFAAQLSPEQMQIIAEQLYVEMLEAGYTSVAEFHYLHHATDGARYQDPAEMSWRIVAAAEYTGIGLTHLPVLYRYSGFGERTPKPGQQRFLHDADNYAQLLSTLHGAFAGKRHRLGIAPHSLRAVSAEMLTQAVVAISALDADAPIHIHIAEQTLEVDDCVQHYGARPVQWLLEHQAVDTRWCLVHATHLNAQEVSALAQSKAVAGICTTTEANLGDGFFPILDYVAQGGRFGLGSDSHISVAPIEELRWLEYGARLNKRERALLCVAGSDIAGTAHTTAQKADSGLSVGRFLYEQALAGGAQALGQTVGALQTGVYADLLVLDSSHPTLCGKQGDRLLDSYIFAGNSKPLRHVMVGGVWQVRDGCHQKAGPIAQRFAALMQTLLAS